MKSYDLSQGWSATFTDDGKLVLANKAEDTCFILNKDEQRQLYEFLEAAQYLRKELVAVALAGL